MRTFRQGLSVARKDLAVELRTKESLNAAGAFAISILMLFSFAFDPSSEMLRVIAGGLLWIVFAFAGALIFNRGFARELPNECMDALLASPLSSASLLLGKGFANFAMLLALEAVSLVVFGIFLRRQLDFANRAAYGGLRDGDLGNRHRRIGVWGHDREPSSPRVDVAGHHLSIADSAADRRDRTDRRGPLQQTDLKRPTNMGTYSAGLRCRIYVVDNGIS